MQKIKSDCMRLKIENKELLEKINEKDILLNQDDPIPSVPSSPILLPDPLPVQVTGSPNPQPLLDQDARFLYPGPDPDPDPVQENSSPAFSGNNVTEETVQQENLAKEEISLGKDFKDLKVKRENQIKEEYPFSIKSECGVGNICGVVKREYFEVAESVKLESVKKEDPKAEAKAKKEKDRDERMITEEGGSLCGEETEAFEEEEKLIEECAEKKLLKQDIN